MNRAGPMGEMDAAAAKGLLAMQHCAACEATQYPPREVCHVCLSDDLAWTVSDDASGSVLAATVLHHSFEPPMRGRLPLRIGLVRFDQGPTAMCFVPDAGVGERVKISAALDIEGRAVMTARVYP